MLPSHPFGLAALPLASIAVAVGSPAVSAAAAACEAAGACEALVAEGAPALDLAQRAQRTLLSPRRLDRQGQALPSIGFVKTHKTGSTTMANILHRLAGKRHLSFITPNDNGVLRWDVLKQVVPPKHQFDLVAVHEMFDEQSMRAYLKPEPFIFSLVRDPVARLDSSFRFRADKGAVWPHDWERRLKILASNPPQHTNEMARDLGWYGGVDIRRRLPEGPATFRNDHSAQAISDWISYIDRTMDHVFLTEHYDEGLVLLARKLSLTLEDVSYVRALESEHRPDDVKPPTDEQLRELNAGWLSVDRPLYEHFVARFWREWEEHGGYSRLGADLAELQARNDKLAKDCAEPRDPELCPETMILSGGHLRAYVSTDGA